jgi:hypothetical protein
MVRVRGVARVLAVLAIAGTGPALAAPIQFTGNVASDFPLSNPSVTNTYVGEGAGLVAGPSGSTPNQLPSGFWIQDIRSSYDAATDTMSVGVQGYQNVAGQEAIFGDSSGNPNPALDQNSNMGGDKSIAISFAPISTSGGHQVPGTPVVIAGIPADKSKVGSGTIDGFTVSQDTNTPGLPQYSFGQQLPQFTGKLAFNPSAAHPDLEFTIPNFSKIPGLNPSKGYYMQVYAGSAQDIVSGEVSSGWFKVPALEQQTVPEPATWLAWMLVAGGAVWRCRRSRPARPCGALPRTG